MGDRKSIVFDENTLQPREQFSPQAAVARSFNPSPSLAMREMQGTAGTNNARPLVCSLLFMPTIKCSFYFLLFNTAFILYYRKKSLPFLFFLICTRDTFEDPYCRLSKRQGSRQTPLPLLIS